MAATQNDLVTQVMQDLQLLPEGSVPTADDYKDIGAVYGYLLLQLADDDYADWDQGSIPEQAMPGLTRVVAYQAAPKYGVNRTTLFELDQTGRQVSWDSMGRAMLRRYMRQKPTYESTPAHYF